VLFSFYKGILRRKQLASQVVVEAQKEASEAAKIVKCLRYVM
jgi:hypothetical protein